MVNGTNYFIGVEVSTAGNASNYAVFLQHGGSGSAHPGNAANLSGSWTAQATNDNPFIVYTTPATTPTNVIAYDSANLSDATGTSNRLTGGTGTFTAGLVSETGVVTDLGWNGNNHTELLYSVKLIAADLIIGDTLRFRVLRNGTTTTMTYSVYPTVNIAVTPPDITQAAYQFFDDTGTESGAAALAAQNTAVNGNIANGDGYGQIRIRLQSTSAIAIPATANFMLQYEKNASGSWTDVGASLLTEYASTNRNSSVTIGTATSGRSAISQSFIGNGGKLSRAGFFAMRTGNPTGNVTAVLYAHTGTFGTTGMPTGTALATSTAYASSTVQAGSHAWIYFDLDQTFTLANGTNYCIAFSTNATPSDANWFDVGVDSSSPTAAGDSAVQATSGGAWTSGASDLIFSVYTASATTVVPYNSPTLTEGAATTNRLGAGTGSFVAGKAAEDGKVDDFGWSANNCKEIIFSIKIVLPMSLLATLSDSGCSSTARLLG